MLEKRREITNGRKKTEKIEKRKKKRQYIIGQFITVNTHPRPHPPTHTHIHAHQHTHAHTHTRTYTARVA